MALKRIEIFGFKSFVERTVIHFVDGINAIVGPNGCGKSNIVDAFLWALGQQSARTLRASSMQDVIFAGSEKRKPQNFAEVTVVLSNEKGILPVEYQEVAITRRLYRDGESEYLLNKKAVRLKDILEMLAHTGVGKEAFAVIGQGQVVEIINQSAQERRGLFEEVAGISHFLAKRKESERKLELAKGNLARAKDIAREVEAQEKILEKQAEEARRYQEMRQKLSFLERLLLEKRHEETKGIVAKLSSQLQASQESLDSKIEQENKIKSAKGEKSEAIKDWQKQVDELKSLVNSLQNQKSTSQKDISFCEEKLQSSARQEKESKLQTSNFQDTLKSILSEIEGRSQVLNKGVDELGKKEELKNKSFNDWQKVQSEQDTLEKKLKAFYSERFSLQTRLQSLEADVKKSQLAEEVALEKLADRNSMKSKIEDERATRASEIKEKKDELKANVAKVDEFKKLVEEKNTQQKEKSRELDVQREKQNKLQQELYEKSAKLKALSQLKANFEGFTSGAKALLTEAKKPASLLSGVVQPLAEALTLEHELINRLYDSCLVVKTRQDLDLVLNFCEKQKCHDVSFLCLELLGLKNVDALADHLMQGVKDLETLDEVAKIGKSLSWVQKKYYIDSLGALHINRKAGESLFTRSQNLKSLETECEELKEKLKGFEETIKSLQDARQELLNQVQKLDQDMRRADMQVVSSNFQLQSLEKQMAQSAADYTRQESEMGSLHELVARLKREREAKEKDREPAKVALEKLEKEFQECEKSAKALASQLAILADQKQKAFFAYDEVKVRQEREKHALELLQVRKKEQESRLDSELKLQKTIEQDRALIERKKTELEAKVVIETKGLSEAEEKLKSKIQEGDSLQKQAKDLEQVQNSLQSQKEEALKVSSTQKVELEHQETKLKTLSEALQEEVPEGYANFKHTTNNPQQIEADCNRTRNSLDRMRNVNLLAVEEHQQTHERLAQLQAQLQDLEESEKELVKIVTELERECRKAFSKTFEEVRIAFKKHFQTLFQGGEADLVLVTNDAGAQGVEIMAKPPGKQMRSMQLLSGGEKSLTAVALLFACFDVRPSPFCILDEVDAPLDETNVERLGNLIRQFCEKTQFLVITHNKKTMNIADTLIGVSMAEKGVSQIISLDFKRRETAQDANLPKIEVLR